MAGSVPASAQPLPDFGPRYSVQKLLGEGGMGAVYKAYDLDLDRTVALKLVRGDLMSNPEVLTRFKQELLLASRISHKNILRIHDLGDHNGVKFISMAYVDGEDLYHLIKRNGKLPMEQAVGIARQLCGALEAAHNEAVVHRDLKPQNVMIDRQGTAYITDFGLAKSLESELTMLTRTGQYMGTPRYMAPEQVECKEIDGRTDLYALGLIMYEMATGDVPFSGGSAMQQMFQRVQATPKDPRELNPEIPEYYARVVLRCLEKDPARRYMRAAEVAADLAAKTATPPDAAVTVPPGPATAVPTSAPAAPQARRRPGIGRAGAIAAVSALLVAIALGAWWSRTRLGKAGTSDQNIRYVAVMPFKVLGQGPALSDVAEGMRDALNAKLFQMHNVRLASSTAVDKQSPEAPVEQLAQKLGVQAVIKGNVQGSGQSVRVVLSVFDAKDPSKQWTQELSGVPQDLLTLEDDAYKKVVEALRLNPSTEELARSSAHSTENIEAYDLYLRGRAAKRGGKNITDVQNAIQLYNQALAKDPGFALAYAGLADAMFQAYLWSKDGEWIGKALAAAQQARRLDENLPEAYFALGSVYKETGKTAEAAAELQHALQLAPNSDEGYRRLGDTYMAMGNKTEALRAYDRAIALNPYYWLNHYVLGQAYTRLGDNDRALAEFKRVTELDPQNGPGFDNIGIVLFSQGKVEESIPYFLKAKDIREYYGTWSNLGEAYVYLKRYSEAITAFQKAVELNPNNELSVGNLADAYRWSGNKEEADKTYDTAISLALKDLQVNPRNASTMGHLAQYYAKTGRAAQAQQWITRARSIDPNDVDLATTQAIVQALGGKRQEALKSLREALQKGYSAQDAAREPEFASLHGDAEFEAMLNPPPKH